MEKSEYEKTEKNQFFRKITKYTIFLSIIFICTLITKLILFPSQLPVNFDAISYFMYSSDIFLTGQLPGEWSPANNGWPIVVGGFFVLFNSDNVMELMQIQKLLSIVISAIIIFPVYFLCKIFVSRKIAIVGTILIALEPRLMINSFLGLTDPLYLLLITTSLALFLQKNRQLIYLSFVVVGLATLVRGEGITLFLVLSIIFFIRFRQERLRVIPRYMIILGLFLLVILPMSAYGIDVNGVDGIFMRSISSGGDIISNINEPDSQNELSLRIQIFIKNLFWIMIPNFIIFIPIGIFLIFRQITVEKLTIILSLIILTIPSFYAYLNGILETRYFFILLPIFVVLSTMSVDSIFKKLRNNNVIIITIIIAILSVSVIFYDYQKPNEDFQRESFEITKEVYSIIDMRNTRGMDGYFRIYGMMEQWPMKYTEMSTGGKGIGQTSTYDSLEDYIDNSRMRGLTHIITDEKRDRIPFLSEIFYEKVQKQYLKQVYDSKENGFNYHVKVFEIDYKAYDIMQDNRD